MFSKHCEISLYDQQRQRVLSFDFNRPAKNFKSAPPWWHNESQKKLKSALKELKSKYNQDKFDKCKNIAALYKEKSKQKWSNFYDSLKSKYNQDNFDKWSNFSDSLSVQTPTSIVWRQAKAISEGLSNKLKEPLEKSEKLLAKLSPDSVLQ